MSFFKGRTSSKIPEGLKDALVLPALLHPHLGILKAELGKKLSKPKSHSLLRDCLRELQQAPSAQELKIIKPCCSAPVNETPYPYIRARQITSTMDSVVKELLFSTPLVCP